MKCWLDVAGQSHRLWFDCIVRNVKSIKATKLLGPLESRVMAVVWSADGAVPVRDVLTRLAEPAPAYTTVMTIMGRLVDKGLLKRRPLGKAYLYEARLTEQEFLARGAQRSVRRLVQDYGDVALAQFAEELARAKPSTLERLRRLKADA